MKCFKGGEVNKKIATHDTKKTFCDQLIIGFNSNFQL